MGFRGRRVRGSGFRGYGLGLRVSGLGFRVYGGGRETEIENDVGEGAEVVERRVLRLLEPVANNLLHTKIDFE